MIELLFVITAVSLVGGLAAAAIAWRTVQENRRRSEARIARLADVIHAAEPGESAPVPTAHLLENVAAPPDSRRRGVLGAVAATAVLVAIGLTSLTGRSAPDRSAAAAARSEQSSSANTQPGMLELVSLVHERAPGGALELHGEVHNPENGTTLEDVTAVAMLFDGQGAYLASGRAPLETRTLEHGGDATFAITVPDASAAARYRVSFRTHERVIPHTDRRRDH
jgi:hypothetical protein